jgi:hypothetical protein
MKERSGLPTFAYVLFGVLALAALMLTLGRKANNTEPSVGSYGPSGLHAFADLLKAEGYRIAATRDPTPYLDPKQDVAVGIFLASDVFAVQEAKFEEVFSTFAKKGGRYIHGSMGRNFAAVTRAARETELTSDYGDAKRTAYTEVQGRWAPAWVAGEPDGTVIWKESNGTWASLEVVEKGQALYLADMAGATNRMIDRADNASIYVSLIKAIAPKGSRLVFMEATWGNASEPGLFETIGSWASAGWTQFLMLLAVIGYSLGKPFGLAEESRKRQVGQRELVDAYAGTLARANATDIALQAVLADADRRLRRALKMDSGLDATERNKRLPIDLVQLIDRIEMAIATRVPSDIAIALANKLDDAVTAFAGDRRPTTRRRKKS